MPPHITYKHPHPPGSKSGSERKKEGKSIEGVRSKRGRKEEKEQGGRGDSRLTLQVTPRGHTHRGNNHAPKETTTRMYSPSGRARQTLPPQGNPNPQLTWSDSSWSQD